MVGFKQFLESYPLKSLEKGEVLMLQGCVPEAVYVIVRGSIKTYTIANGGNEHLIAIHSDRSALPVGFAYGLVTTTQYFYAAYTPCQVRLIPPEDYIAYIRENPQELYQQHLQAIIALMGTMSRINGLEQSKAIDKIAFTLLYLAEQVGSKLLPYKTYLKLNINQQELADMLGITRETAGHELKKLEKKNAIMHGRKSYVLYLARLRSYIVDRK